MKFKTRKSKPKNTKKSKPKKTKSATKKQNAIVLPEVKKFMDILNKMTTANFDPNLRKEMVQNLSKIVHEFMDSPNFHKSLRNSCKRVKDELKFKMLHVLIDLSTKASFLKRNILHPIIQSTIDTVNGKQYGELYLTFKYLATLWPKLAVLKFNDFNFYSLTKTQYVKRMLLDNPQLHEQYWKQILSNPGKNLSVFPPVISQSKIVDGIDRIFDKICSLTDTQKKFNIVYQMNCISKIVSIVKKYSTTHQEFQFEAAICVLEWKLTNSSTSIYMPKILLWVACAILRYSPNSQHQPELPDSVLDALCPLFFWSTKNHHVANLNNISELVALRQHLGKNRSHQMNRIDNIVSIKISDWNFKVATNPIRSREDFVTPSDGKLNQQLAYTFHDADSIKKLDLYSSSVKNVEMLDDYETGQQKMADNFGIQATKNDTYVDKRSRPAKVIHEPTCKLYKVLKNGSIKVLNRPCLGRRLRSTSSTTLKKSSKNAAAVVQCTCSARNLQLPISKQIICEPPTSEEIFNQCIQIVPTCSNTLEIKTELFEIMLGINEDYKYLGLIS